MQSRGKGDIQRATRISGSLSGGLEADQFHVHFAVWTWYARQRIDRAVLPHRDRIHVRWMAAVFVIHGTMVHVFASRDVVRDQVKIFLSLGLALSGLVLARDAPAVTINRTSGQVVDRLTVGSRCEAQVAVAELVEH